MAEARITEFFGETQIREEVLDFMGLGSCMPREAWRLPSPQPLQSPIFTRIQKTKSSSSEPPPYSSSGNFTSTPAAMRDLAIQAKHLFLELFPSGVALSPWGRFLGSPAAGAGVAAGVGIATGADERLWGLGGPVLPPPLPPPLPPLSPFGGFLAGVLVFWRSAS